MGAVLKKEFKMFLIGIFIVFLLKNIISENVETNYPQKVEIEQEFIFKIKLIDFNEDVYDVKIDILSNNERIAKILNNGEWKSTYYYINDVISPNEEKEFTIKVVKDFEIAQITIKIRDSSGNVKIFEGYEISKFNNQSNENEADNQDSPAETNESDETFDDSQDNLLNEPETQTSSETPEQKFDSSEKINEEPKIIFINTLNNSKDINTQKSKEKYAIYGLIGLGTLICLLFALKKSFPKKYQNEFQED